MKGRALAFARALIGFVLTAGLVAGVPYLLVSLVGNPLPSEVPSVDEIRILLTQNGQGFTSFLISTLAILIWFIWAQLVVALVIELVATARRSETRRLPTAPGIQTLAARLIASMTLATTLVAGPILAPAVGALHLDSTAPISAASSVAVDSGPTIAAATRDFFGGPALDVGAPAATGSLGSADRFPRANLTSPVAAQVRPGPAQATGSDLSIMLADQTELWDLADAAYGDGVSWKAIALANAGSVDATGTPITIDTESVAAGTTLRLPAPIHEGAVTAFGAATSQIAEASPLAHVVEAGDSMWTIAETDVETRLDRAATEAEIAEYWVKIVAANQEVASGDADLIYPDESIVMPSATERVIDLRDGVLDQNDERAPAPSNEGFVELAAPDAALHREQVAPPELPISTTVIAEPSGDLAEPTADLAAPVASEPSAAVDRLIEDGRIESAPDSESALNAIDARSVSVQAVGLASFGAAILAAGIVGAVRRRRDLQRRTRAPGTIARPPSTEAAAFEAALVHSAHEVHESQLGAGWRMLPAGAVASMRAAGPLHIHAEESGQLSAVSIADTGGSWESRRVDLVTEDASAADSIAMHADVTEILEASPETVTVVTPEPGSAAAPTTLIVGTDDMTGEAVLLDLASATLIELQGDVKSIQRFTRTAVLDLAVSDRADDLCVIAIEAGHELADLERVRAVESFPDALVQAVKCGHAVADSSTPVVIVSSQSPPLNEDSLTALLALGAVVLAPGVDATVQIILDDDHATVLPAGTSVALTALASDDYLAVSELIETTSAAASGQVDPSVPIEELIEVIGPTTSRVEPGPVEVKVLGPVVISGADSFSSLKAVDVITYLAFHRHGVDADQIKTWVWPPFDPPTDKAFANVLSRARTGLGTSGDDAPYLSRAGADKTYRLNEAVTTDFDRFRALVELADEAVETTVTLDLLKQALELIRGVAFTGGAASSFAWADNHVRAQIEYTIDEAAHRCADLALEIGDLATARWAALKGHELVPGCEQCFRRRFLIASAGHNRSELRRAMADLEASAAAELGEPEAVDTISGDLLDLYHELDQALVAGST